MDDVAGGDAPDWVPAAGLRFNPQDYDPEDWGELDGKPRERNRFSLAYPRWEVHHLVPIAAQPAT